MLDRLLRRTPKKHECDWLVEVNRLMREKRNHDCEGGLEIFNFVNIFGGSIEFADWLREVLAVKKWKDRAEQQYFLNFEFAEN